MNCLPLFYLQAWPACGSEIWKNENSRFTDHFRTTGTCTTSESCSGNNYIGMIQQLVVQYVFIYMSIVGRGKSAVDSG